MSSQSVNCMSLYFTIDYCLQLGSLFLRNPIARQHYHYYFSLEKSIPAGNDKEASSAAVLVILSHVF